MLLHHGLSRITWFWRDNVIFGLQKRIEGFSKEEAELRAEYYLLKVIYVDPETLGRNQLCSLFCSIRRFMLARQPFLVLPCEESIGAA